jgi:dGTPase
VPAPDPSSKGQIRDDRYFKDTPKPEDRRTEAERDYDRVIYTSAFMRLSGVSQVAHTADAAVVHNRLTHSLKVASIGRGLALRLARTQHDLIDSVGGVNPDVVAAAAIAHDLGHPPFGHVTERLPDTLVKHELKSDAGFEGNPQSFRVVTKLAIRKPGLTGLNLTRATLNAMLKYPWMRESGDYKNKKWGSYHTEGESFTFARTGCESDRLSAEAEIMTFADDIAYSTHDLEDYYRAGLVPIDRILNDKSEQSRFLEATFARWKEDDPKLLTGEYEIAFQRIIDAISFAGADLNEPYCGKTAQRAAIRSVGSTLIDRFFGGIRLRAPTSDNRRFVEIDVAAEREIRLLKEFMWHYVIPNRSLATQEEGQRKIIRTLFQTYKEVTEEKTGARMDLFPTRYQERLKELAGGSNTNREEGVRILVDVIADMTEYQAFQTFQRITGSSPGSFLEFFQR